MSYPIPKADRVPKSFEKVFRNLSEQLNAQYDQLSEQPTTQPSLHPSPQSTPTPTPNTTPLKAGPLTPEAFQFIFDSIQEISYYQEWRLMLYYIYHHYILHPYPEVNDKLDVVDCVQKTYVNDTNLSRVLKRLKEKGLVRPETRFSMYDHPRDTELLKQRNMYQKRYLDRKKQEEKLKKSQSGKKSNEQNIQK